MVTRETALRSAWICKQIDRVSEEINLLTIPLGGGYSRSVVIEVPGLPDGWNRPLQTKKVEIRHEHWKAIQAIIADHIERLEESKRQLEIELLEL